MVIEDSVIISSFVSSVVFLVGAIRYLYKRQERIQDARHRATTKKLNECEKNHEDSNNKIIELEKKVSYLQGATDLHNSVVEHIERLRLAR